MPLSGNERASAVYNVVASQPNFSMLTTAEQQTVKTQLQVFYGADTTYLVGNATLLPGSFASPAGQAVQVNTATGTGSTSSPAPLSGSGKLS